ncbi:hypothetical protein RB601_004580 [Gaeumannomyces tritici]
MSGFGDFTHLCHTAPLPLCASVGPVNAINQRVGIEPDCYARSIELANTIIFQGATSAMHIVALCMTVVMVLHVRGKFTAVGRKEILNFFYLYMILTFLSLCVDAGVIPPGSAPYPYFVAIQNGLSSTLITCLLINGFVGFQLYEDGTPLSLWMMRLCSLAAFTITFLVSLATFKSWAGLSPTNTIGLFVVLYLLNAVQLFVYVVLQIMLVVRTLQDRWPLGDIAFGVFFVVIGQVILYAFSSSLCEVVSHYMDGLFFATTCNLLGVMMVYKVCCFLSIPVLVAHPGSTADASCSLQYWDSITKEDLEFSVGTRMNNWEVKELLPEEERRGTIYNDDPYAQSSGYDHPYSNSPGRSYPKY